LENSEFAKFQTLKYYFGPSKIKNLRKFRLLKYLNFLYLEQISWSLVISIWREYY